jgi:tetraacyldisaccharide 4'-kinase
MYLRPDSTLSHILILLLNTVSIPFKIASWLYLNIKAPRKVRFKEALIISIDNLAFGGTGKTPLILEIGQTLEKRGLKFAVVSRGFRSKYENRGILVQGHHRPGDIGDEAALLKNRFSNQDILIGKDRNRSIRTAIQRKNKIILLDDGFQSTDIYRDIKVMLFNPEHPYYYLRNFKWMMKGEDFILSYLRKTERRGTARNGVYHFELEGFCDRTNTAVDIGGSRLVGFSALADNRRFKKDLERFNCAAFQGYPDHFSYSQKELATLEDLRNTHRADFLVCTEKDFVKLKHLNLENMPLIYVKNRIKFNFDLMDKILNDAKKKGFV